MEDIQRRTRRTIEQALDTYHVLQERIGELIDKNPRLKGADSWLPIWANDLELEYTESGIRCHGHCWTLQTGGSNEPFEFTIPWSELDA